MKEYGKVRSTHQPKEKVVDEYSVWIAKNITSVKEKGETSFIGFEYVLTQYDKDEYITILDDKNKDLEKEITQVQEAMCGLYESMS